MKNRVFTLFIIIVIPLSNLFSQNDTFHGLYFPNQYKSTFNLTNNKPFEIKNKFELNFKLSLSPDAKFGNIFFIKAGKAQSIYLNIIPYRNNDTIYLSLFINRIKSKIEFPLVKKDLSLKKYYDFSISLDSQKDMIAVNFGGKKIKQKSKLEENLELKIIFGLLPSWKYLVGLNSAHFILKDVRVKNNSELKHYWPLNEITNNIAYDIIGDRIGIQKNCEWLIGKHIFWKQIAKFKTDVFSDVAFNSSKHEVLIVNQTNLIKFNVISKEIEKIKFLQNRPLTANTVVYNNYSNKLLAYYHGKGEISEFDDVNKTWSYINTSNDTLQNYYSHTNFIDRRNGDLYILGGYGWYKMKNDLQKYNFKNKTWDLIKTSGDYFSPRANLLITQGYNDNEFYVFGGTGNKSGKQEEGFSPIKDLFLLDVNDYSFKKLWENSDDILGMPVSSRSGNLILNNEKRELYAILNNDPDDITKGSKQKLNAISIDSAKIEELSYSISNKKNLRNHYIFFDEESNELILTANQLDKNKNYDSVFIFSLAYPPLSYKKLLTLQKEKEIKVNELVKKRSFSFWYLIVVSSILGISLILLYQRKRAKKEKDNIIKANSIKSLSETIIEVQNNTGTVETLKNSIFFFGEFQVIDKNGNNITTLFSPKNKELFLFILLKTLKFGNGNNNGISSTTITNTLWPDFPPNEAKNVRGVTIHRLRELLEKLDTVNLVFENKLWYLIFSSNVYFDYGKYLLISSKINTNSYEKEDIESFLNIVKDDGLLPFVSYKWLDSLKYSINEQIIKDARKIINNLNVENNSDLIIRLSDKILSIDQVYEYALISKINALNFQNQYSSMKKTYDSFCKEYKLLYDETYPLKFEDLIKPKNN